VACFCKGQHNPSFLLHLLLHIVGYSPHFLLLRLRCDRTVQSVKMLVEGTECKLKVEDSDGGSFAFAAAWLRDCKFDESFWDAMAGVRIKVHRAQVAFSLPFAA